MSRPQNGGVAPLAEVESNARNLLHADSSWRRVESLHLGDLASISTSGQKQMVQIPIRTPCYFAHFILNCEQVNKSIQFVLYDWFSRLLHILGLKVGELLCNKAEYPSANPFPVLVVLVVKRGMVVMVMVMVGSVVDVMERFVENAVCENVQLCHLEILSSLDLGWSGSDEG